jgi:hypothetical protein
MRRAWVPVVLLLAAVSSVSWTPSAARGDEPGRKPQERLIGAYYYPWYYKERWTREPVANTPRLGWYTSDDRGVAAEHIRNAKQADLDFFLVSWLSPDGREGKNFREAVLPELEKADFRFALLYETPLALGLPAGKPIDLSAKLADGIVAGDRFVEHFDHLGETYLKHGRYLRLDGKAVVVIYLVRDLVNAGPYLKAVRERLGRRGIDLHLIADVVYWEPADRLDWALLKEHFQAVTAYNMYYRPKFLEAVRDQFRSADREARSRGLRLVPNVMPGYDDTPLRGTERVTIHRRRGQFYRDYWAVASEGVRRRRPAPDAGHEFQRVARGDRTRTVHRVRGHVPAAHPRVGGRTEEEVTAAAAEAGRGSGAERGRAEPGGAGRSGAFQSLICPAALIRIAESGIERSARG